MKYSTQTVNKILSHKIPPRIEDIVKEKNSLGIESASDLLSAYDQIRKTYFEKKDITS